MNQLWLVAASALLLGAASPPAGATPRHGIGAEQQDGATVLTGHEDKPGEPARNGHSGNRPITIAVPACPGNDPHLAAPRDALCREAAAMCAATPDPADLLFWYYSAPGGSTAPRPNDWTRIGQACLKYSEAQGRAVPALSLDDFRRLPLPAGGVHVQPSSRRTLVNVPTNVYVEAEPIELDTTVLGLQVRVRATPAWYEWDYGDGTTLRTTDSGDPYPTLKTAHVYKSAGVVRLRLSTAYSGEYSVEGGPWLPVDGVAIVQSSAISVEVSEAISRLVA